MLPIQHAYHLPEWSYWSRQEENPTGKEVGFNVEYVGYDKGKPPPWVPVDDHFCGSEAAWLTGAVVGTDTPLTFLPQGISTCCARGIVLPPAVEAQGGEACGGSAPMGGGFAQVGAGGEACGGLAEFLNGYGISAAGGEASGGLGTFSEGFTYSGDGGEASGGFGTFSEGYRHSPDGGEASGGFGTFSEGFRYSGTGGEACGGLGTFANGFTYSWTGGEACGGAAAFGGAIIVGAKCSMPIGAIIPFGGAVSEDCLECDGSAVSRTTYADLFAAIGTTWGGGNGFTTFNLPDLRGRVPLGHGYGAGLTARTLGQNGGYETHQLSVEELPEHNHVFSYSINDEYEGIGGQNVVNGVGGSGGSLADTYQTGDSVSHNNMQPWACTRYGIVWRTTDAGGGGGGSARSEGTIAATGTDQGSAAQITTDSVSVTGANGNSGVILPDTAGAMIVVYNADDVNFLPVYPPVGASIGYSGANFPFSIGTHSTAIFMRVSPTKWASYLTF